MSKIHDKKLERWLEKKIEEKKISGGKQRIREYAHMYNRARQLLPQMIDFVETIFAKRARGELNEQLVFLGRGARPFYRIAFRLARLRGVNQGSVKIIEAGRRLTGQIYSQPEKRKELLQYLKSAGIDISRPITFIDTGVIGTVPNDLIQLFKLEGLNTPVNGFMFYGRDVPHQAVKSYAPSDAVSWKLRGFSEREARSLIEELPKPVNTVKGLVRRGEHVKANYVKASEGERIGALLVRKAITDGVAEYIKKTKKRH